MKMSISDLIDKFTIIKLKKEKIKEDRIKEEIIKEFEKFENEIKHLIKEKMVKDEWIKELYEINKKMWDLENKIGDGKKGLIPLDIIGKKCIEIRRWNKKRIFVKNLISEEVGEFKEIKRYHASE
jgi:hypothetical protein